MLRLQRLQGRWKQKRGYQERQISMAFAIMYMQVQMGFSVIVRYTSLLQWIPGTHTQSTVKRGWLGGRRWGRGLQHLLYSSIHCQTASHTNLAQWRSEVTEKMKAFYSQQPARSRTPSLGRRPVQLSRRQLVCPHAAVRNTPHRQPHNHFYTQNGIRSVGLLNISTRLPEYKHMHAKPPHVFWK